MAPIKLEDTMKKRLEERTIEPTMAAWDRISSKLDAEQGVQKSRRVLWMSIAASFVGGALVTIFLVQNMGTDTTPVLVDANETPVFVDPTEEAQPVDTNNNETLQEVKEAIVLEQKEVKTEESVAKTNLSTQNDSAEKSSVAIQEILNTKKKSKNSQEKEITAEATGLAVTIENEKAVMKESAFAKAETQVKEAVVAQVENPDATIDAEIDALLKNAQRELISNQTFNQKTNTVDANALLLDVEAEVAPTSFRNKIFDAVIDGFERTKDAVVNRNN